MFSSHPIVTLEASLENGKLYLNASLQKKTIKNARKIVSQTRSYEKNMSLWVWCFNQRKFMHIQSKILCWRVLLMLAMLVQPEPQKTRRASRLTGTKKMKDGTLVWIEMIAFIQHWLTIYLLLLVSLRVCVCVCDEIIPWITLMIDHMHRSNCCGFDSSLLVIRTLCVCVCLCRNAIQKILIELLANDVFSSDCHFEWCARVRMVILFDTILW